MSSEISFRETEAYGDRSWREFAGDWGVGAWNGTKRLGLKCLDVVNDVVEGFRVREFIPVDKRCFRDWPADRPRKGQGLYDPPECALPEVQKDENEIDPQPNFLHKGPLSFASDFLVVNGVPAFHLKSPADSDVEGGRVISCCQLSQNGSWLVSGHNDGSVRLWDAEHGGEPVHQIVNLHKPQPVCDVHIQTKEGDEGSTESVLQVFSCDASGQYYAWTPGEKRSLGRSLLIEGKPDSRIIGNPYFVWRNGKMLIVFSSYKVIEGGKKLLKVTVKEAASTSQGSSVSQKSTIDYLKCSKVSPDGNGLLIGYYSIQGNVKYEFIIIWKKYVNSPRSTISIKGMSQASWSNDGKRVVAWNTPDSEKPTPSAVRVHDVERNGLLKIIELCDWLPSWCTFVPSTEPGKPESLACCAHHCKTGMIWILVYELETFTALYTIETHMDDDVGIVPQQRYGDDPCNCYPRRVNTSDDSNWLGLVSKEGKGIIFDAVHGVEELQLNVSEHCTDIVGISMGPKAGKFVVWGSKGMMVMSPYTRTTAAGLRAIHVEGYKKRDMFPGESLLLFSGNGQVLGLMDKFDAWSVIVWDLERELPCRPCCAGNPGPNLISFGISYDAKYLITVTRDDTVVIGCLNRATSPNAETQWDELGTVDLVKKSKTSGFVEGQFIYQKDKSICSVWEAGNKIVIFLCGADDLIWVEVGVENVRANGDDASWDVYIRRGRGGHHCCFFENGRKAMVWEKSGEVESWDLVRRDTIHTGPIMRDYMKPDTLFPISLKSSSKDRGFGVLIKMNVGRAGDHYPSGLIEGNPNEEGPMQLQQVVEYGTFVLAHRQQQPSTDESEPLTGMKGCQTLYLINRQNGLTTELISPALKPTFGCAISYDGRRIACVTVDTTIRVWSPWASEGLIPDLSILRMNGGDNVQCIAGLLDQHGPALINMPDQSGVPLVMQLANRLCVEEFDAMVKWVKTDGGAGVVKDHKMRLRPVYAGEDGCVKQAIQAESPDMVARIMEAVTHGVAHNHGVAFAMRELMEELQAPYLPIFTDQLENENVFIKVGDVRIPLDEFGGSSSKVVTETHDYFMKPEEEYARVYGSSRSIRVPSNVHSLLIPNAAMPAFNGLLGVLLLHDANAEVFGIPPVKYLIDLKWHMYGKGILYREIVYYILFLLLFSFYSISVGHWHFNSVDEMWSKPEGILSLIFLALSWIFGVLSLVREVRQCWKHCFRFKTAGAGGFYLRSYWNFIELVSYVLLVVVIPALQFNHDPSDNLALTVVLAIESIILWWKFLYYLRPFQDIGPLRKVGTVVIAIGSIMNNTTVFLGVAAFVLFGFTEAFYALYRHVRNASQDIIREEMGDENYEAFDASFNGFFPTMFTMFAYTLGDFDVEVLYNIAVAEPGKSHLWKYTSVIFFVVFMFLMAIILLNLLIAIMADSYNTIKETSDLQLLKARANAIHDVETMMSSHRVDHIEKYLKRYLHVIEPDKRPVDSMGHHDYTACKEDLVAVMQEMKKEMEELKRRSD